MTFRDYVHNKDEKSCADTLNTFVFENRNFKEFLFSRFQNEANALKICSSSQVRPHLA